MTDSMNTEPRVASLLPSATELVCAVGAQHALVGRSHECDFPSEVGDVPCLTRPRVEMPQASGAIDRSIRDTLANALTVYEVNVDALEAARPDVIVTQDLCHVCAVSLDDVHQALRELARTDVEIVSLRPTQLEHLWEDLHRVGTALGRSDEAERAAAQLEARCAKIAESAASLPRRSVLTIEWLDPVMVGGTWMPELVDLAGGQPLVTRPGEHAPTLSLDQLAELQPDVVLIKPCGFDLARSETELPLLPTQLPWSTWRAVTDGQVFVADGNAYFNRSGPRLVESLEILAAIVHPAAFPEFVERHSPSVRRVDPNLELVSLSSSGVP